MKTWNKYTRTLVLIVGFFSMISSSGNSQGTVIKLEDFGAVYNDTFSDQQAFEDALKYVESNQLRSQSGDPEAGLSIELSAGTLILDSTLYISDIFLTIQGAGIDSTILLWKETGGIKKTVGPDAPHGTFEIRDLSILAGKQDAGTGLNVQHTNNGSISFIMRNVRFSRDSPSHYWNTCFHGDFIPASHIMDCQFEGAREGTSDLILLTSFCVSNRIINCQLNGAENGIRIVGEGEGYFIGNNNIADVSTGIWRGLEDPTAPGSEPLMHLVNNVIKSSLINVYARGFGASSFSENTFILDENAVSEAKKGIWFDGTNIERRISIYDNLFINESSDDNATGISIENYEGGLVLLKNTFDYYNTGINIENSNQVVLGVNNFCNLPSTLSQSYRIDYNSTNVFIDSAFDENELINCFLDCPCQAPVKSVTSSFYYSAKTGPMNVMDCNPESHWASPGIGESLTFELSKTEYVTGVEISFGMDSIMAYYFEILTSVDGNNYISRGSYISSGENEVYEHFSLTPDSARFIKITGNGNSESEWNRYRGVRIMTDGNEGSCGISNVNDLKHPEQESLLSVYPNPVQGNTLNIEYISWQSKVKLEIFNIYGNLVLERELMGNTGYNNIEINFSQLSTGVYIILINENHCRFIRL